MVGTVPEPGTLDALPEQVRLRVVALAAEVLPDVPRLPPAVRRVASFAPARRARLGGTAIAEALADDEVRERVGVQASARPAPDAADLPGAAARAWLVREEGWEDVLAAAREALPVAPPAADEREVARLRRRLADAEQAAREQRAAHRVQVEEYKSENAALRRKLGDARAAQRAAREEADEAIRTAVGAASATESATAALEKENRRLRAQVEQLEAADAQSRRAARADRDDQTLRARILLETVIDAAAGLRRELALPPVGGAPADRVQADLAEAGARTPSSAGALGPGSGALLEQLLAMPRSHLVIDGYNVSKTAWSSSSLEAQRLRLVSAMAPLVARTGAETTVVFDAAETDHRPPVSAPRGVRVLYSPRGVIADDVIRDLVAAEPTGRVVVVVTGDRALGADVARGGARVVAAEALLELLGR